MSRKIAIVTDSNSNILPEEGLKQGVYVLPMPFLINGNPYLENINLSQEEFYRLIDEQASISTSQPSIGDVTELWTELLQTHDEILHIPMSSGLSNSCATAQSLAKDFDGKVQVVDNHRIAVLLKASILDAVKLRYEGKTAAEIKEYLEKTGSDASIYITVDTMKYLKRGGRITPAAAMIGGILKIKPVLQIHGSTLDKYSLARSMMKAKETMKAAIKQDLETRFAKYYANGEIRLCMAYTGDDSAAKVYAEELQKDFPDLPIHFCAPLSLSVACHVGPNALGLGVVRILK